MAFLLFMSAMMFTLYAMCDGSARADKSSNSLEYILRWRESLVKGNTVAYGAEKYRIIEIYKGSNMAKLQNIRTGYFAGLSIDSLLPAE